MLDSVVRGVERLYEGELCGLKHRRKVIPLGLLCKIYHRADHHLHKFLYHFAAIRNTRVASVQGELALINLLCRTVHFSQSFLPAALRLWNLLPSRVFNGSTLSWFKSAMNLCLRRG